MQARLDLLRGVDTNIERCYGLRHSPALLRRPLPMTTPDDQAERDRRFEEALAPYEHNIRRYGEIYPGATRDFLRLQKISELPLEEQQRARKALARDLLARPGWRQE